MDTLSVMIRRILRGQNPFRADRQHLHHILLQVGYSEAQATAVLLVSSAALGGIGFAGWCYQVPDYVLFYVFMGLFVLYCFALHQFSATRQEAHTRSYGY
jgi:UDP-GlcNAc:undecaprenyl-phosphate GlcNAc-1-phosphate transferase